MFLKRIVLHGFKSFADRTEFEFGAQLIGVVGPNGCGKSNILDAVRWVLGEQSARSLRGGKMADVIFAGSRTRKPANRAEVTLVFDNRGGVLRTDEDEVTVGRVLYASGESEYRLNGKACRLKDIKELLLDTGVGVDAYSVIEQGRVDLLLQASPLERREIFEEAAGISRYKVRRAEAQRKLERTQNNLLRLHDVLEELERRLRSVRLAAGKARNFLEYDARLRALRSSFSMAEYHELEQKRRALAGELQRLRDVVNEERAALAASDAESAERAAAAQKLDEGIQHAESALHASQTELSALAERITQGQRRCDDLKQASERRRQQAVDIGRRLAELQDRSAQAEGELKLLRAAEVSEAERIQTLVTEQRQAEGKTSTARTTLEQAKSAAYEAARQAALLQNEEANLAQQEGRLRAQLDRLTERHEGVSQTVAAAKAKLEELGTRLNKLDSKTATLSAALRENDDELAELDADQTRLDAEIGETKEQRSGVMSRLAVLEDMERRLEGVEQGTQTVLAWRDRETDDGNIVGLVAELLRIDDPRLPLLEPVLAQFESHIVVRCMGQFLEEFERRGETPGAVRALALDRVSARTLPSGYESTPGFVARASDWVICADDVKPLVEHLLGRVIVVDTLARGLRLAHDALAGYVFVTLDGWTVGADGRVARGVDAASAGLISRKAEVRQLRVELDEVETHLEQRVRARAETEQRHSDVQLRREGHLAQIATVQREHAEACAARDRTADEQARSERELRVLDDELAGLQRSRDEVGKRLTELQAERSAAGDTEQSRQSEIERLGRELGEFEALLARLAEQHTAALVERGRAAEKRSAGEENLRDLRQRLESLTAEQATAEREAAEAESEIGHSQAEVQTARELQSRTATVCEEQRQQVLQLREQRQALREQLEQSGATARAVQKRLETAEVALHAQEVEQREIEVRAEGLVARVREELELDLVAQYAEYEHTEQDWTAIREEIEELRGKIARLGNVNLDAIQELEELTPRHEQLVAQREDLMGAIARLEALIDDLDQESRTRFASTFEEVRANFQEMFRKLFGGGKADIILEDPENPLECGIEIIARPPGKEPRSISLLSGGEKTLTAVGLLMAVFKSRPSPFAILDEVDAALDESNVDRFNTLLSEFLSQTQFVIITHSKRTMASVDVLYGITMEEPGVSKRVSVRFDDRVSTPSVA